MIEQRSGNDWLGVIDILHTSHIRDVERAIASRSEVQSWLQQRAQTAAADLMVAEDVAALIAVQTAVQDDFGRRFPNLVHMVSEATSGTATLVVDWEPEAPDRSSIRLRFNTPIPINAFRRLRSLDHAVLTKLIEGLSREMPSTRPYVGHPHQLGVMATYNEKSLAFQIVDQVHDDHRSRWLRLLPTDIEVRGRIRFEDGAEALAEYFLIPSGR